MKKVTITPEIKQALLNSLCNLQALVELLCTEGEDDDVKQMLNYKQHYCNVEYFFYLCTNKP